MTKAQLFFDKNKGTKINVDATYFVVKAVLTIIGLTKFLTY